LLASKYKHSTIVFALSQRRPFGNRARIAASAISLRRSGESFAARAFAAADAICLRRTDESFAARAFPPMLCISEAESLFFTRQS
jgi:hypothetical protein